MCISESKLILFPTLSYGKLVSNYANCMTTRNSPLFGIRFNKGTLLVPILSQLIPVNFHSIYKSIVHFITIHLFTPWSRQWSLIFMFSNYVNSLFPRRFWMPRSRHAHSFAHLKILRWSEHIALLLIIQFSQPSSSLSLSLKYKHSPRYAI